jgi:hypothetical protein
MERGYDKVKAPDSEQWKRLFDLSVKFREIAPWQYQTRRPLFGVELPDRNETVYVCTVGFDAHRPGMIAYYGDKGYHCCREESHDQWHDPLELIFRAPHLKVLYMDRDQLRKEERKLIRRQGLKFRNRFNWPAFRSFMPGYVTWHLTAREADDLAIIMEQTCAVLTESPDIGQSDGNWEAIPVRRLRDTKHHDSWITDQRPIPDIPRCCQGVTFRRGLIRGLRDLPQTANQMSLDLFVTSEMLHDDQGRPYYPMCLVLTDETTGLSIHSAIVGGTSNMKQVMESIGESFAEGLRCNKARPEKLSIHSWTLAQILEPVLNPLDISIQLGSRETPELTYERWGIAAGSTGH